METIKTESNHPDGAQIDELKGLDNLTVLEISGAISSLELKAKFLELVISGCETKEQVRTFNLDCFNRQITEST